MAEFDKKGRMTPNDAGRRGGLASVEAKRLKKLGQQPKKTFTARELAQEVLKRCRQDIPETVVKSLKVILRRFVETGEYRDEIGEMIGEQPTPPLAVQRFAEETSSSAELLCAGCQQPYYCREHGCVQPPARATEQEPVAWRYKEDQNSVGWSYAPTPPTAPYIKGPIEPLYPMAWAHPSAKLTPEGDA
jgi:hypothetical protein